MNNRPVMAAVLRRQSHPIIINGCSQAVLPEVVTETAEDFAVPGI
jgi:hypothetical protein